MEHQTTEIKKETVIITKPKSVSNGQLWKLLTDDQLQDGNFTQNIIS